MSITAILGVQWGDEGKARIVDVLAPMAECVIRFQGGSNAGHTVVTGSKTFKLHQVPSGVLHPGKKSIIASGAVVEPGRLVEEIRELETTGLEIKSRLIISERAHVVLPWHLARDLSDGHHTPGRTTIGTTGRGIGPCYTDKACRHGFRLVDLLEAGPGLPDLLLPPYESQTRELPAGSLPLFPELVATLQQHLEILRPMVGDTRALLERLMLQRRALLFEGAQGTMLDLDQGTYPFVTSSTTTLAGIFAGTGLPPQQVNRVIGVLKPYTTRVGHGPFPTELTDQRGEALRQRGQEFGTTTGRPRRCGWLDLVALGYALEVNGVTELALTKLDVLSGQPLIPVCLHYQAGDRKFQHFPAGSRIFRELTPHYMEIPGWTEDLTGCRSFLDLPSAASNFVETLEQLTKLPVSLISVGPERSQLITR